MHTARLSGYPLAPLSTLAHSPPAVDELSMGPRGKELVSSCVGQQFGRYNICFELACGGMATVYLAKTADTNDAHRFVALKIIHRHLAGEQNFVQMFLDEAMISSQIRHPNVCHVFEFNEVDGHHYLAMEYLLGESLSLLFRKTLRAPPSETGILADRFACIIADVCNGLHAAHELCDASGRPLDIVHRDISPENIFVTYDGIAKIVDFGLAIAAHQTHTTRAGIIRGKFAYIAPEVVYGVRADRRADVWSLGVVLWELLTGRRLFRRDTDSETLRAVTDAPIPPPSEVRVGLPAELDELVMRALQRNPDDRYATARQLGAALLRYLSRRRAKVGPAELAAWMGEAFAAERRRKRQLLDAAELIGPRSEPAHALPIAQEDDIAARQTVKDSAASRPSIARIRRRRTSMFAGVTLLGISALAVGGAWKTGAFSMLHDGAVSALLSKANAAFGTPRSSETGRIIVHEAIGGTDAALDRAQSIELQPGKSYVLEIQPARRSELLVRIQSSTEPNDTLVIEPDAEPQAGVVPQAAAIQP